MLSFRSLWMPIIIVVYDIIVGDEDGALLTVCATMRVPRRLVAGVDNRRWAVRTIASLHSLPPPPGQSKRRDDPPGSAPRLSVRLPSVAASLSLDWLKVSLNV